MFGKIKQAFKKLKQFFEEKIDQIKQFIEEKIYQIRLMYQQIKMTYKIVKATRGTAEAVGYLVLMLVLLGAAGFAGYYFAPNNAKEAVLITVGIIFVIAVMVGAYFAGDTKKLMK